MAYLLVAGNPVNGLEFYGPYESSDEIEAIVSRWDDTDWWITEIAPFEEITP